MRIDCPVKFRCLARNIQEVVHELLPIVRRIYNRKGLLGVRIKTKADWSGWQGWIGMPWLVRLIDAFLIVLEAERLSNSTWIQGSDTK